MPSFRREVSRRTDDDADADSFRPQVRHRILTIILLTVFVVFTVWLFCIQLINREEKQAIATRLHGYEKSTPLYAKRGEIYLMDGKSPVAAVRNKQLYTIFVDAKYANLTNSKEAIQENIDANLGDQKFIKAGKARFNSWDDVWNRKCTVNGVESACQYVEIAWDVDFEHANLIKCGIAIDKEKNTINGEKLTTGENVKDIQVSEFCNNEKYDKYRYNTKALGVNKSYHRAYIYGDLAAQTLGFQFGYDDVTQKFAGGYGVEGGLNSELSGTDGSLKAIRDVNGIPLSIGAEYVEKPAVDGKDIVLTIDVNIQRNVENIIKKVQDKSNGTISSISALVMNPRNGQVWAMANYPTFDPESFAKYDESLKKNRTTQDVYEAASLLKPFIYAVAIDQGKLKPTDTYYNAGKTKVADWTISNASTARRYDGQTFNFNEALSLSLNTGSIEALRRIGDGRITKAARETVYDYYYNRFGFGNQKTGIEVLEDLGTLRGPSEDGAEVQYATMTYGYGMNVSMIQVAAAFSSLINGGKYYQPTLVAGTMEDGEFVKAEEKGPVRSTISASTSATMREMLRYVRKTHGHDGEKDPKGYYIGIKTGTGEELTSDGYDSKKTFIGAIGFGGTANDSEEPEYVVMLRINGETLLWGGETAVPVFTSISNYMIQYLRIPPTK